MITPDDKHRLIAMIIDMPVPGKTTLTDCKHCDGGVYSLGYRQSKRDIIKLIEEGKYAKEKIN